MNMFARMSLKLPYFTTADGTLHALSVDLADTPILDPFECAHHTTMCSACVADWLDGYDVKAIVLLDAEGIERVLELPT